MIKRMLWAALSLLQSGGPLWAAATRAEQIAAYEAHKKVVADTVAMAADAEAQELARKHGLRIMNVTWEDTGRSKGSSVGPNISDMSIQVAQIDPRSERRELALMPVIRYPNFEDKSADLRLKDFLVLVGNEKGRELKPIRLGALLADPRRHLHAPESWLGGGSSWLAPRDTKVLVSAQACFLPVPKSGLAEFNPAVFNYQSYRGEPAVLTILATREGSSVTVIDNARDGVDGFGSGQRLFFNKNGRRAVFTGQRLSDFKAPPGEKPGSVKAAGQEGLNLVLLVQVPLKQKNPRRYLLSEMAKSAAPTMARAARGAASDVETAVIGHGRVEGPYTEIGGLAIERDPRYPIRVTVQFYKATSNGVVAEKDMAQIAAQIRKVYEQSDYVGSLVVDGLTRRVTEHGGPKGEPPDWWERFLSEAVPASRGG